MFKSFIELDKDQPASLLNLAKRYKQRQISEPKSK